MLICRASTLAKVDLGPSVCYKQSEGYFASLCFSMLCFQHPIVRTWLLKAQKYIKNNGKITELPYRKLIILRVKGMARVQMVQK